MKRPKANCRMVYVIAPQKDKTRHFNKNIVFYKVRSMNLLTKIHPLYFFVSFAIGLFVVYIMAPPPQVVVKFPSPYNAGKVVYKGEDTCFKYKVDSAECPLDRGLVKDQPV